MITDGIVCEDLKSSRNTLMNNNEQYRVEVFSYECVCHSNPASQTNTEFNARIRNVHYIKNINICFRLNKNITDTQKQI